MQIITDGDVVSGYLRDESGLRGSAAGVVRPRDVADVADFVLESHGIGRRILPVGLQTASTGAAVPQGDVVMSFEHMTGVVDIDADLGIAEVLPGTVTAQLKREVESQGLFYGPDPTSQEECTIGGNVAANASGARSFRWGMTADWVTGLEVVTGTGDIHRFDARQVDKNTAGYMPFHDPMRLFLGSEGTLGIVTRVWVRLVRHPGPSAAFILFFKSLREALDLTVQFRQRRILEIPRCAELFGSRALEIIGSHPKPPVIPASAKAGLYVEFGTCRDPIDKVVEHCIVPLAGHGVLVDDTVVAETASERAHLRELRHYIPETCYNSVAEFHSAGGLKVSTEFCVPIERLIEMLDFVDWTVLESGLEPPVIYGHVGNGHPHIFMRGKDRDEVARCKKLTHLWYK